MAKKSKKNNQNRERDRFTVVLESIQSDFQIFGEKLDFIDNRLDRIEDRLDRIENRIDLIESQLGGIELRLDKIEAALLDKKADLERLEKLEKRVKQIEIILARGRS